tara:strand:- start:1845 stop:2024 length:180 start_codon:yes stop_codon:yes gene_type:complete
MEKEDKKHIRKTKIDKKKRDKYHTSDAMEHKAKVRSKRERQIGLEEDEWEDWDRFYNQK